MSNRLDPVGWLRLPRRSTMLRMSLVAALLLTAAGVLYADPGGSPPEVSAPPAASQAPAASAASAADPDRLPIPDGLVGVPVPLAEPTALAVLRAGDRVDLLAVRDADPAPVAGDAAVLAVDQTAAAVLLALTPAQATEVVSAPDATRFAVIVRS